MADTPTIVDAIKTEPTQAPGSGQNCGIPIKIDTSKMQHALQTLMGKQMQFGPGAAPTLGVGAAGVQTEGATGEKINPSVYMKQLSESMSELYTRFEKLKRLATELHGRQLDAPIPDHVKIKNIAVEFSVTKDGKEENHTADIKSVTSVGDITGLVSGEFGVIILALTEQSKQLEDIAHKTNDKCGSALKEWEKANKDKRIVKTDGDGNVNDLSVEQSEVVNADAPVTLEAS
jgi:hypothetical protein